MYSEVVVGVDGHGGGRDAATLAMLLGGERARLALVNVRITDPLPGGGARLAFDVGIDEQARALLARERGLCGRPVEIVRVAASSVGAGLERIAGERGADLIVVGSCHRSAIGRVLVGDDAASVIHHAHRSVAIAPTGLRAKPARLETIGVAYDGSAESEVALSSAQSLAKAGGGEVIARCVVTPHVMTTPGPGGGYMEEPQDLIAHKRAELRTLEHARLEIVVGSPGSDLIALSETVDVLVCGSRHNGLLRRIVLGSTSGYLAHHARCPLLITPAPAGRPRSTTEYPEPAPAAAGP